MFRFAGTKTEKNGILAIISEQAVKLVFKTEPQCSKLCTRIQMHTMDAFATSVLQRGFHRVLKV